MKNSGITSLSVILVAVILWGSHSLKSQFRGQQRDRSVIGEEFSSSPTPSMDVATRGPIGSKAFDIKNFESFERPTSKGNKDVHRSLREMQRLLKCFESENCNFDQSSAQSYRIALRENLMNEIFQFQQVVERNNYQDPNLISRATEISRFFLEFPDDDIKDQALSLAASLPISNSICDSIIVGLGESVSAPLYEKGLEELKRYISTSEKSKVDEFLLQSLVSGSSYVSKLVARESLAFISNENTPRFLQVLNQLPKRSQAFELLKANVDESMRM